MSTLTQIFSDIANSIRSKASTSITYKPTEMANAINNISSGGVMVLNSTQSTLLSAFNLPVVIEEGVTNLSSAFANAKNFNQPITIPNGVTNVSHMFDGAHAFNQPITIPNSVTNMSYMFAYTSNFNQPITIPDGVNHTAAMFTSAIAFNQPVTISNSVTNMSYMFQRAKIFNQLIDIPSSVTNVYCLLDNANAFNATVWFKHRSTVETLNAYKLFGNTNSRLKKIIRCQPDLTSFFNGTTSTTSVTGTSISWTKLADNNGYYSISYNIYIYNNLA